MMHIRDLLSRIRWDPSFGTGRLEVGYFDRVLGRVLVVPFDRLRFEPHTGVVVTMVGDDGVERRLPLHRIRLVTRDGTVIWSRGGTSD